MHVFGKSQGISGEPIRNAKVMSCIALWFQSKKQLAIFYTFKLHTNKSALSEWKYYWYRLRFGDISANRNIIFGGPDVLCDIGLFTLMALNWYKTHFNKIISDFCRMTFRTHAHRNEKPFKRSNSRYLTHWHWLTQSMPVIQLDDHLNFELNIRSHI